MMRQIFIIHFIIFSAISSFVLADLEVTLPNGKIRGREQKTPKDQTYYAYQGIPYATPPLGNLRFQAPTPAQNWDGILETTKDSNICYSQRINSAQENEDCLYINVFTPVLNAESNTTKLPVMFWIYGGAFRAGAAQFNNFGPDYFVEKGIVVVTFNYRLGPFGFLATGDTVIPGNAGLKDQSFALKWTHDNVALFGGDPEQITIFGQSAGGASVGYQILSKLSSGLFRAAIAQSGSPLCLWASFDDPKQYAIDLVTELDSSVSLSDSKQLLEYLQGIEARQIDTASTNLRLTLPVIEPEHDGAFITIGQYELLEKGDINKVPLLAGINSEEEIARARVIGHITQLGKEFDDDNSKLIPINLRIAADANATSIGAEIKKVYLEDGENFHSSVGAIIRYISDNNFTRAVIKHAELQSKFTDVYFYQFSYDGIRGGWNGTLEGAEKVGHGEDLQYEFVIRGTHDNSDLSKWEPKDVITHQRLIELWSNFAKYMNPTPEKSELLQNIIWPKVDASNFQYLDIDENLQIKTNPKESTFKGWCQIFEKYGVRPFTSF